jgi:hypothetical protein
LIATGLSLKNLGKEQSREFPRRTKRLISDTKILNGEKESGKQRHNIRKKPDPLYGMFKVGGCASGLRISRHPYSASATIAA